MTPDVRRIEACFGPEHADRSTMAILQRHAALCGGEITMTTITAARCATCRFAVPIADDGVPFNDRICGIDPPSAKGWPEVCDSHWCGQHATVPATPQPGEPAHWADLRA